METPSTPQNECSSTHAIERATGTTPAERYLGQLCEKTFLSLWSYPGVYRDQGKPRDGGDGKEVCDLLVVFGEHLIIFSDKHCLLKDSGRPEVDWQRWFRRAIQDSAEQAWGASRWIREHPDRLFLDRNCTKRLPIDLPGNTIGQAHLVIVAHGVSGQIRKLFPGGSGSLFLNTSLRGFNKHTRPFEVGDLDPLKPFVHVLDDDSLDTVMRARDTISDFVSYLRARERLLRGNVDICATGEEQLLAIYLSNFTERNEHDFAFPIKPGEKATKFFLPEGHWEKFQHAPERLAQLEADKVSYAWDKLIEKFNFHALRGDQYFVTAGGFKDAEKVLRFMAREPRWKRRYLAKRILEALKTTPEDQRRLMVIPPIDNQDPHYVFLLLPVLYAKNQEEYRFVRRSYLQACCAVVKLEYPEANDIVGIATEPGITSNSRSEDALYLDARVWNAELEARAKEYQKELGILKKARRVEEYVQEYPSDASAGTKMKNPRNKPCPCGSGKKYKRCCMNK